MPRRPGYLNARAMTRSSFRGHPVTVRIPERFSRRRGVVSLPDDLLVIPVTVGYPCVSSQAAHETAGFQSAKVPRKLNFQAQTCSA